MKNNTFSVHLRRAFSSPRLYISILLYALALQIPSMKVTMFRSVFGLYEAAQIDSLGFAFILSCVIPALPYALTYVDDYNTRMLYNWSVRSGMVYYAVSYYVITLVTAYATSFLGSLVFLGINSFRDLPFLDSGTGFGFAYADLYNSGHKVLYVLAIISEHSLGTCAMAGITTASASIFHHKFASVSVTVLFYLTSAIFLLGNILDPAHLIHVASYTSSSWDNLATKLFITSVYCIACGLITTAQIKRSVQNA